MSVNVDGKEIKRGDQKVEEKENKEEENKIDPSDYSCQILLEKTTLEKANDKSLPSDGYLVWYNVERSELLDVTRSGKMANVFDLYYDKYGKELKRIEWGYGTINPAMWGYKQPDKKKKRK